ncbi:hypothetical protein FSP39_005450, partial [Pinctada imbricata]
WHKGCFKCQECNMTLNMKNYKGYNKLPYCNAHYPTTKHTVVADTPEARRIAENTKIQSNVQYHSDFEKAKGSYIQVADTPDMIRHQLNTKNTSLIEYHRDFEESKSRITPIVDTPEIRTHIRNTKNIEYQKDFEKSKGANCYQIADTVAMETIRRNTQNTSLIKYHEDFEKMKGKKASVVDDPELMRIKQNTAIQSNIEYHKTRDQLAQMEQRRPAHEQTEPRARANPGKISEYDPEMNSSGTPYSARNQQARVVYDSNVGKVEPAGSSRRVGSIADYDPMNENYGSISGQYREPPRNQQPAPQQHQQQQQYQQPPPPQPVQQPQQPVSKEMVCQAMYDYTAADTDEVSFMDGDLIRHCQPIDAGWMEGTVERTGQRGMLPSNYVEPLAR